jgi:hypothetical protein
MQSRRLAFVTVLFIASRVASSDATSIGFSFYRPLEAARTNTVEVFCRGPVGATCEFILLAGSSCASGDVVAGPNSFELSRSGQSRFRLPLPVGFQPAPGALFTLCGTVDFPGGKAPFERQETYALIYKLENKLFVPARIVERFPRFLQVQPQGDVSGDVSLLVGHGKTAPAEATIETTILLPESTGGTAIPSAAGDESCNGTPISDTATTKAGGRSAQVALHLNALGQKLVAQYRRLQATICSSAQVASGTTVAVAKRHVTLVGPRS